MTVPPIPLNFRRFVKLLKRDLFPALARKTFYENIESLSVLKGKEIVFYVVYDNRNPPLYWQFTARGYHVEKCGNILMGPKLPEEEIRVTSDFWTCQCSVHYIHHRTETKCPICKLHVSEDTEILPSLKG